jgi:plasmid stability protein
MAKLILNDLDPQMLESLKMRAAKHNRSVENELKAILQEVITAETAAQAHKIAAFRAEVAQMRQSLPHQTYTDSAVMVREDRDQ